jgi:hypothetical protein
MFDVLRALPGAANSASLRLNDKKVRQKRLKMRFGRVRSPGKKRRRAPFYPSNHCRVALKVPE